MIIFDTNVWVAFLDDTDSQHHKARTLLQNHQKEIVLPEYVLLETATILEMRMSKNDADTFLQTIQENENVEILFSSENFCRAAIEFFQNQNLKNLSFVDMTLLLLSQQYQIITFDKQLAKALSQ